MASLTFDKCMRLGMNVRSTCSMTRYDPDCMTLVAEVNKCCRDRYGQPWPSPPPQPHSNSNAVGDSSKSTFVNTRTQPQQQQQQQQRASSEEATATYATMENEQQRAKATQSDSQMNETELAAAAVAAAAVRAEAIAAALPTYEKINRTEFYSRRDTSLHEGNWQLTHTAPSVPEWTPRLAICTFVHDSAAAARLPAWLQHHMCAEPLSAFTVSSSPATTQHALLHCMAPVVVRACASVQPL